LARLFVAVIVPEAVLDRVAALPRPEVAGLRWTTREQWHVTLRFLGQVDGVHEALAALRSGSYAQCEARLGPEVGRFGRRILHVPVSGLDVLATSVVAATADVGNPPEDRAFRGHVTLARARSRAGVDMRPFTGAPIAGSWRVDEVVLFESHLHPKGARYEIVGRMSIV
jgi:2'-5' RNA ligase